jgi:tetratricopeptide (TPR) repeat protein
LDDALRFGEHHLELSPHDEALLDTYVFLAAGNDRLKRVTAFLEKGLGHRPVAVAWHRRYQELARRGDHDEEALARRYDRLLADSPNDAALIYLRGRLELLTDDAMDYYDRAIAANPNFFYPHMAKAYHLLSRGELEAARDLAAKAKTLAPDDAVVAEILFEVRSCLGEHRELEDEIHDALGREPLDLTLHERLLQVLVAQGRSGDAAAAQEEFASRARREAPQHAEPAVGMAQSVLDYLEGDFGQFLAAADRLEDPALAENTRFIAQLERGEPEEAEKHFNPDSVFAGRDALLLYLAWDESGPAAKAEEWLARAIETFEAGPAEERWAAGLLGRGPDLDLAEVDQAGLPRQQKAVLLVALAARCPDHQADLLEKARKLNGVRSFPHRFLQRTMEEIGR